jgi:hypothetical protein
MCIIEWKVAINKLPKFLATWAFAIAATSICADAFAQQPSVQRLPNAKTAALRAAELEAMFWTCDFVATTRGVYATPIELCSAATDELKNTRFGGDFMELQRWWKLNKSAQHERLTTGHRVSAPK